MAVHAAQLSGLDTGTHTPQGFSVIFSQIPAVRIKVFIFQGHQIIMIKKAFPWFKGVRQGDHLGMTGGTDGIALFRSKIPAAQNYFKILWRLPLWSILTHFNVFITGAVAGLAADARFFPEGVLCVGFQIIVG